MNQLVTRAIVLSRTDYGEADRIITLLTPDHGKLRLMAKGVRRIKSKLAGGVELFSVSHITFIQGRGEVGTLISSRLETHYGQIVGDIQRTMLGYELIKQLNRATEDEPEADYFELLIAGFAALNDSAVAPELIQLWFNARLLKLAGHDPNLATDTSGQKLESTQHYSFDADSMTLAVHEQGSITANDIKFLRLLFAVPTPAGLAKIDQAAQLVIKHRQLIQLMLQQYIR